MEGGSRITRNNQTTGGQRSVNFSSTGQERPQERRHTAQLGRNFLRSDTRNPRRSPMFTDTFMTNTDKTDTPKVSEQQRKDVEDIVTVLMGNYGRLLGNKECVRKYTQYIKKHLLELAEHNPRNKNEMYAIGKLIMDSLIQYGKLDDDQKNSVVSYVGASSVDINTYERTKAQPPKLQNTHGHRHLDQGRKLSSGMDGMCASAPRMVSDITVYRGCVSAKIDNQLINVREASKDDAESWIGKYISEEAYLSTSANRPTAIGHCLSGGALLEIHVPKGWRGTYVTLRHEKREFQADNFRKEYEIIFGRGQQIKITNVIPPNQVRKYYIIQGEFDPAANKMDPFEEDDPFEEEGNPFEEEVNPFEEEEPFESDDSSF